MLDDLDFDVRHAWLVEARAEAREQNPLIGYCRRVYFIRTKCQYRSGASKGKVRKRRRHEVELLQFLPSGRCVEVRDTRTRGLSELAEEIFSQKKIDPHMTVEQAFLEWFRKL